MDVLRQRPGGRGVLDADFGDGDRVRVPNSNIYGVELEGVDRNGPADLAGLKKGDIIVEFDGKPIRTAGDLRYRAGAATPGVPATATIDADPQTVWRILVDGGSYTWWDSGVVALEGNIALGER